MNVHGMKECCCAVQEGDKRQSQACVPIRLTAKLRGQKLRQEFEGRHVFFAGEGEGPIFGDQPEVVGMGRKKVENAAAGLRGSGRRLDGGEEIQPGAAAQERDKIILVGKALIESRGSSAAGAGNGAHGEGLLAAFAPHAVCGIEDAAFQTSISLARHATALPSFVAPDYILYTVKDTLYKE